MRGIEKFKVFHPKNNCARLVEDGLRFWIFVIFLRKSVPYAPMTAPRLKRVFLINITELLVGAYVLTNFTARGFGISFSCGGNGGERRWR